MQRFGIERAQHIGFMKGYLADSKYVLFDGTNTSTFCLSGASNI